MSSSSSLSPSLEAGLDPLASYLEPHPAHLELEDELEDQPLPLPVLPMPRHPAVVRTTSIQPGFGGLQSTPASKMAATHSMGVVLSPIVCPGTWRRAPECRLVVNRPCTSQRHHPMTSAILGAWGHCHNGEPFL